MKITPGKLAGLKSVSNDRNVIAAAAMDQRGSLQKSLSKERGSAADGHDLEVFKSLVTEVLTRYASAILLDPEYGLPAAQHRNGKGLLLAYEKTGYDATTPGRLPDLLDVWSVRRLAEAGADCIKILLYYTPLDRPEVNDIKHAWVERIGDECRAHDIPFFLELVGYDETGADEKAIEFARKKPAVVAGGMKEFSNPRYGVDVLKVEVPINIEYVAGTQANSTHNGSSAYTRAEALDLFRSSAAETTLPFIYLSAGVSNPVFIETLALAGESGVAFNGVLCGRATWKDGIAIYAKQGPDAFRQWLETTGTENIQNVNKALEAASPWTLKVNP